MRIGKISTGIAVVGFVLLLVMLASGQGATPEQPAATAATAAATTDRIASFSLEFVIMVGTVVFSIGGAAAMLTNLNRKVGSLEQKMGTLEACLVTLQAHVANQAIHMSHDGLILREEYERRHRELMDAIPVQVKAAISESLIPFLNQVFPKGGDR